MANEKEKAKILEVVCELEVIELSIGKLFKDNFGSKDNGIMVKKDYLNDLERSIKNMQESLSPFVK